MNHRQIKKLIETTLKKMDMWSEEAVELVFLTGLVESGYKYISQIGSGIARSFWQVEVATAKDCIDNYLIYRQDVLKSFGEAVHRKPSEILAWTEEELHELIWHDMALGIAFCRIKYRRVPKRLPKTLDECASQWKEFYNTVHGAGTVSHFLEMSETRKDK
jgi:hypothetical protein|tara:strand:+ start:459 stop:941 length:483 start_codon:yes stop_codon:yes gene_type:complete